MSREVTLLAMGPSRVECPHDTELWATMYMYQYDYHIDKLFCTHNWNEYNVAEVKAAQKRLGFKLIASTMHPELDIELIPIEDILREFGTRYYVDMVGIMLAYAVFLRYDRIKIYGCDCMTNTFYANEKAPTEFWVGVARGRGIEVQIASSSALCKLPEQAKGCFNVVYGLAEEPPINAFRRYPETAGV